MRKTFLMLILPIVILSCSEQDTVQPNNSPSQVNYNRVRVNGVASMRPNHSFSLDEFANCVFKVNTSGNPTEATYIDQVGDGAWFKWVYDNNGRVDSTFMTNGLGSIDTLVFTYSSNNHVNTIIASRLYEDKWDTIITFFTGNIIHGLSDYNDPYPDSIFRINFTEMTLEHGGSYELSSQNTNCNPAVNLFFYLSFHEGSWGLLTPVLLNHYFPNHPYPPVFFYDDDSARAADPSDIQFIRDSQNRIIEMRSNIHGFNLATIEYFTQ